MNKIIIQKFLDNPKLLNHLMENSYYIKNLNRNPNFFKEFQNQMKVLYKERTTDKVNMAIDGIEMLSSVIDTVR